jgi:ubiquinone biosynthesis protein
MGYMGYCILFLIQLFWIVISETFFYVFTQKYSLYIQRITQRFARTNILFVKVFQCFCLNNHYISDELNNVLLRYIDNVPYSLEDIDLETLIEITNNNGIHIDNFEKPVNAGMISLVFVGYKREGIEKVAIKIKRKNIDISLESAIENVFFVMRLFKDFSFVKKYQLSELVHKNVDILRQQTNFEQEVTNLQKVRKNCEKLEYIRIPFVYPEITQKYQNVIVMEYIEGRKIGEIQEKEYRKFSKKVIKFGCVTTFIHGITHGDLHAGNILFLENGKIGVIDFGIVYTLSESFRKKMLELLTTFLHAPIRETTEKVMNSGIFEPKNVIRTLPKEHYENILHIGMSILEETLKNKEKVNQTQIFVFFSKLFHYLNNNDLQKYQFKPSDEFVKIQLVLAMAHGITLTLCKEDYLTVTDEAIEELFHTRLLLDE